VGKVVMITVPIPWICLLILFIRGITLPNAIDGLAYYLTPDFSKIFDPEIWLLAYGQIFFSLSLGSGVMIAYGSYLQKKPEITNSAIITALANCGTSFFAGFAVFSTLGYLAYFTNVNVEQVTVSGSGLAYMAYPTAISMLPAMNSFFAFIFFLMLVTLGIDSAFALQEAFTAGILDKWHLSKSKVNFWFCVVGFFLSLLFTTHAGSYWLDITDHYIADFALVFTGLAQCIIIGYLLGTKKLRMYLNEISEIRLGIWWDIMIKYFTPIILLIILAINIYKEIKSPFGGFPWWTLIAGGWGLLLALVVFGYILYRKKSSMTEEEVQ